MPEQQVIEPIAIDYKGLVINIIGTLMVEAAKCAVDGRSKEYLIGFVAAVQIANDVVGSAIKGD